MKNEKKLDLVPKQFRKYPILWLFTYKLAEKFNRIFSKYGNKPYLNKDDFTWTKPIEENADSINKELHAFLYDEVIPSIHEIDVNWKPTISDDRWKSFFLVGYGRPAEENCQRCPITYGLVKSVPGLVSAFFSVLKPGATIPPHRGPFNGVLTYHMGLKLPKDREQCFIKVDKKKYVWEYGEGIVFDDTYIHEVENNTDEIRVILMLNFARPVHPPFSRLCNYVLKCISELPFVERGYQKLINRDYSDVEKLSKTQ